jgi:indole-3-glycerol phosphate synthase
MSFLEEIVDWTKQAVDERRSRRSLDEIRLDVPSRADSRPFIDALRAPGISLIAEFKRSSPSHPAPLRADAQVEHYVDAYERGGARALSILTEERCFSGSLEDLRTAREKTKLPLLRKDFVVDEYQVYEAAEAGADAILLIAAVLRDDGQLASLHALANELGLDALVEVRDEPELRRALSFDADLIGVNNRNLETSRDAPRSFDVDITRTARLFDEIPASVTVVAESGLRTRAELDHLESLGVAAALVGGALMEAPDPVEMCLHLTQASGVAKLVNQADQPALV